MANTKISVPQKDGEVTVSFNGDEPTTYKVNDGQISVPAENVDRLLAAIDGSKVAGGSSTGSSTKET